MSYPSPRLSACREPTLSVVCTLCPRAGRYDVVRAIERHGDVTLIAFLALVSGDCAERTRFAARCGARYGRVMWE